MITQSSVEKFLDELASGNPTPGGGSAAAIMGAMGAALVSMVCNVTIGKKGYEGVEAEMRAVRDESERVRRRLTAMVAEDIAAFDSILAAYKLPKATDDDKARRVTAIQAGLRRATETPLDCACAPGVIALARRASEHGYLNVISDGGVGVLAGFTGLRQRRSQCPQQCTRAEGIVRVRRTRNPRAGKLVQVCAASEACTPWSATS